MLCSRKSCVCISRPANFIRLPEFAGSESLWLNFNLNYGDLFPLEAILRFFSSIVLVQSVYLAFGINRYGSIKSDHGYWRIYSNSIGGAHVLGVPETLSPVQVRWRKLSVSATNSNACLEACSSTVRGPECCQWVAELLAYARLSWAC